MAVNETERSIRFGSCERYTNKLLSDASNLKQNVERFLPTTPNYQGWTHQYVGIAPALDAEQRAILTGHNAIPQDLIDLTTGLN